jgi:hypothetical protein
VIYGSTPAVLCMLVLVSSGGELCNGLACHGRVVIIKAHGSLARERVAESPFEVAMEGLGQSSPDRIGPADCRTLTLSGQLPH